MASGVKLRQIGGMDLMNQNFLLASVFWGGVAGGYWIYGWKQKSWVPLAGGAVMMGISFFLPALPMSFAGIAIILIVWWLMRQGY